MTSSAASAPDGTGDSRVLFGDAPRWLWPAHPAHRHGTVVSWCCFLVLSAARFGFPGGLTVRALSWSGHRSAVPAGSPCRFRHLVGLASSWLWRRAGGTFGGASVGLARVVRDSAGYDRRSSPLALEHGAPDPAGIGTQTCHRARLVLLSAECYLSIVPSGGQTNALISAVLAVQGKALQGVCWRDQKSTLFFM